MAPDQFATVRRLLSTGSWLEAEAVARQILAVEPANPEAMLFLGIAIAAMGETERAAPALEEVARRRPTGPHPCHDLAIFRPPLPRGLIRQQYRACLRLSPGNERLRLEFAEFLLDNHWPAEAEAVLADGSPTRAAVHLMGLAQAERGHFHAAIGSFSRAVTLDPTAAETWSNLGAVLKIEDRFDEAIAAHDQAVRLAPNNPRLRVNRATTLLKAAKWQAAWQDYEWRLRLPGAAPVPPGRLLPSMGELGDLNGLTVAVLHEDGFGDTLQFLRYLPLLARRGAQVVACVPPALTRLVGSVPGVARVVTHARRLPPYDFICPFFSLPRAFGTTVRNVPPIPSLAPDPALRREWALRLPRDGMLVGLVWAGQSRPWLPDFTTTDRRRNIGLAAFEPLSSVSGVRFVSLQMGPAARQKPPPELHLTNLMPQVRDFADTAAIVAALDLVISVNTSVVHLAGLYGKRVFLLDRYDGCWRWLSGRGDSPWYPNLTIFRQEQPDDWSVPIARALASLEAMALFHGASRVPTIGGGLQEEPASVA